MILFIKLLNYNNQDILISIRETLVYRSYDLEPISWIVSISSFCFKRSTRKVKVILAIFLSSVHIVRKYNVMKEVGPSCLILVNVHNVLNWCAKGYIYPPAIFRLFKENKMVPVLFPKTLNMIPMMQETNYCKVLYFRGFQNWTYSRGLKFAVRQFICTVS